MNQDLKTSLEELADAEYADAPPSVVDISRARADGRRRMLAARVAPIGGGLAVVAACALVVNGLGGASPADRPESTSAAAGDFTGTDPLSSVGVFGYLPDGFQVARHDYGAAGLPDTVTAQTKPMVTSSLPGYLDPVQLQLSSSATEPTTPASERTEVKVQGSPKAYIVRPPYGVPDVLELQWQTASGSWFTLGASAQIPGADLQAQLIKVAESVTAEDAAVPMPIHVEGVPKSATLTGASLENPIDVGQDPSAVRVSLSYTDGKSRDVSFGIVVIPAGWKDPQSKQSGPAPALRNNDANACKDSEGLQICVLDSHDGIPGVDPLDSVGGAKGLLARITSLGKDRANWTTHVLN